MTDRERSQHLAEMGVVPFPSTYEAVGALALSDTEAPHEVITRPGRVLGPSAELRIMDWLNEIATLQSGNAATENEKKIGELLDDSCATANILELAGGARRVFLRDAFDKAVSLEESAAERDSGTGISEELGDTALQLVGTR